MKVTLQKESLLVEVYLYDDKVRINAGVMAENGSEYVLIWNVEKDAVINCSKPELFKYIKENKPDELGCYPSSAPADLSTFQLEWQIEN